MKKRILAALLLVAMLVSMLAACGGNTTNNGDGPKKEGQIGNFAVPEAGYDGSEVTIKFAHTMGANLREVLDYHIGEFNKLYPNITIEHSSYGGWGDIANLINTEIMGDNQPNIAYCYPDHVAGYNMSKSTVILDDLINSKIEVTHEDGTTEVLGLTEEQINDFYSTYYAEGKVFGDGLMYTLPLSKSTEVLYYNKTFFDANNIKVPTTWDEMEAVCEQILKLDPKCIPLGYDAEENWFITLCEQYGYGYTSATGDHYLFNTDNHKAFVKELREWRQKGYFTTEALQGGYTSSLFTEPDKSKTHTYMCIGSTGGAGYQIPTVEPFEVGVAPIPQVDQNNKKAISQGPSLCILKGGKTTDQQVVASWLFVKYLCTNLAFQTEFSSTSGYTPVIKSAMENETYKMWLDKANGGEYLRATCVKLCVQEFESSFVSPAFNGSSVARVEVGGLLAACVEDKTDNVDKLINDKFQDAYEECVFQAG